MMIKQLILPALLFVCVHFQTTAATVDTVLTHSAVMHRDIKAVVIEPADYSSSRRIPVIYLLHGFSGNYSDWVTKAPVIKALADQYHVLLVCPDGGVAGWYFDSPTVKTSAYETYVASELVTYIDRHYATLADRRYRAITGLSMGGHGALFLAFKHQTVFGAAGSMSGGVDIRQFPDRFGIEDVLGKFSENPGRWEENSVVNMLYLLKPNSLAITVDCGDEDFMYSANMQLHERLLERKIPHDFTIRPGSHSWDYWTNSIAYHILFFSNYFGHAAEKQTVKLSTDLENIKFTVSAAPEWSALLKRSHGWFGGDGIYTIPFNGMEGKRSAQRDSILFIFSDTMIGDIKNQTIAPGATMIHNSVAVLKGNLPDSRQMKFYWDKDSKGQAAPIFVPHTPHTDTTDYYWLGDGFVNRELGNSIYIFGYRVRNVSTDAFGFREVGNTLIKIPAGSKPPYRNYEQRDTPFYLSDEKGDSGSFGAGIYVNTKKAGAARPDGYIYVYGVKGMGKQLLVSRVLPHDFEDFDKWTYWNGNAWVKDIQAAAAVTDGVSNELSVSDLPDGRYALVFQLNGMSTTVGMRIGATPAGPFGPVIKLWDCKPDLIEKTFVVYNAKVHPSLSQPNELLISYNINSTEFMKDLKVHPNLYRPRFIRVKFQ